MAREPIWLPVFAEYERAYADTAQTGLYPIDFKISKIIDEKFDCANVTKSKEQSEFD